jgi:hypothetical protein
MAHWIDSIYTPNGLRQFCVQPRSFTSGDICYTVASSGCVFVFLNGDLGYKPLGPGALSGGDDIQTASDFLEKAQGGGDFNHSVVTDVQSLQNWAPVLPKCQVDHDDLEKKCSSCLGTGWLDCECECGDEHDAACNRCDTAGYVSNACPDCGWKDRGPPMEDTYRLGEFGVPSTGSVTINRSLIADILPHLSGAVTVSWKGRFDPVYFVGADFILVVAAYDPTGTILVDIERFPGTVTAEEEVTCAP